MLRYQCMVGSSKYSCGRSITLSSSSYQSSLSPFITSKHHKSKRLSTSSRACCLFFFLSSFPSLLSRPWWLLYEFKRIPVLAIFSTSGNNLIPFVRILIQILLSARPRKTATIVESVATQMTAMMTMMILRVVVHRRRRLLRTQRHRRFSRARENSNNNNSNINENSVY